MTINQNETFAIDIFNIVGPYSESVTFTSIFTFPEAGRPGLHLLWCSKVSSIIKYMNITNGGLIISSMWIASGIAITGSPEEAVGLFFVVGVVNIAWIIVVRKNK